MSRDSIATFTSHEEVQRSSSRKKVLLAEDNPLDQVAITRLLAKLGFEVSVVQNGQQAVEACCCDAYGLVLLDILMPEMDGFEAAHRIRQREGASANRIPIIALTAYSLKAVQDKCLSVGMDGYLAKPVDIQELRSLCSRYLASDASVTE